MNRFRHFWRSSIFLYLWLIIAVLALATAVVWFQISNVYRSNYESQLVSQISRLSQSPRLVSDWTEGEADLRVTLAQLGVATGGTLTAYDVEGQPIASFVDETIGESIKGPELSSALTGEANVSQRISADNIPFYSVAAPVFAGDNLLGALQLTSSAEALQNRIALAHRLLLLVFFSTAFVISLILLVYSYRTTRDLERLTEMVERITYGDLGARTISLNRGEVGQLALALNQMADRLQSQTIKRRKERDRLNTVLRTMNDGIIILNRRGEIRSMNPAAARILNVNMRSAHRKSFIQVAKDFRIAEVWKQCQRTGAEQSDTIELANETSIRVVITPFLKRRARGYLVMIQDLTQLRHLQTVRQDFVSNVSHELRTPLASLRALVETLRDGALDDPPAAKRFLERMEIEVDALTQMVTELMELSRIESGKVPLQLESVAPQDFVCPAIERLRPQADRADIHLSVDVSPALPNVYADRDRVQQIVTNLVHNAIKFTPDGGSVHVNAERIGDMVHLHVHDTGIGIPLKDLDRVFERFYKTDSSLALGGTGLGLSVASHLVRAHGGEIWADSVEGEWSEFSFSLPVSEETPAHANVDPIDSDLVRE